MSVRLFDLDVGLVTGFQLDLNVGFSDCRIWMSVLLDVWIVDRFLKDVRTVGFSKDFPDLLVFSGCWILHYL